MRKRKPGALVYRKIDLAENEVTISYNRSFWQALLMILSMAQFFGGFVGLYLAVHTWNNEFWLINGPVYKKKYGIQIKYFLPGGLVFFGFLSFLLSVTGMCLVKNNDRKEYKYISAVCSVIMCFGLIYAGNYSIWTANNVENQLKLFCDGGFPKLTDLSKTLIQNMIDAEFHHISRYMCNADYCPCSTLVDKIKFGDRASEFQFLSNAGSVKKYYSDCYPEVTELA